MDWKAAAQDPLSELVKIDPKSIGVRTIPA